MIPSRLITGIIFLIFGIVLTVVGIFAIPALIWGIVFLALGIYMLVNDNEDMIEPIKSHGGKKKNE